MDVRQVPIADLHLDPANARKGRVDMIADSLREFGQHRPVVVQQATGRVIAGNHLVQAAQALGWTDVNVLYVDDDDLKATRRGIADNATGDHATWDKDALALQVRDVGAVPGLDEKELKELADRLLDDDEETPQFPIVSRMSEQYHYVVIVATNEVDGAWLETRFDLRREVSYLHENKVGLSRVVTVERARELLGL